MNLLKDSSKIPNAVLVFGCLVLVIVVLGYLFWRDDLTGDKWPAIISGLLTGSIVASFQVFLSWREMRKLDKFQSMRVIDLLPTRDDSDYYRELIQEARNEIKVHGVTCKRFLDDFANLEEGAPDKNQVLLRRLDSGVSVRILVAESDYVPAMEKPKAQDAVRQLEALNDRYPQHFHYAYYKHPPAHSIVVIDDDCIVGPSFQHLSSKFSPALRLFHDSQFAQPYLQYFDNEWQEWGR